MVDAGRRREQFESMALRRLEVTRDTPLHPAYVVWELTLACDQPCTHCGSRAGDARANELSTDAALKVVAQLAAAGTREVVLIGGEAYLHPGFLDIMRRARARRRPPHHDDGRTRRHAGAGREHEGGRALHRFGEHRRARAHARSDAGVPRQLRVRHRGAAPPPCGGRAHGVEHQHQPTQRRRPRRGSTTTSPRSGSRRGRSRSPRRSAARPTGPISCCSPGTCSTSFPG